MSDDRMDRAERIRRMNEGRASDDGDEAPGDGEESASDEPADGPADGAVADEVADGAIAEDGETGEGPEAAPPEDAPDPSPDDEATATALRAAQASASVDGGVDVGDESPGAASAAATAGVDGATASDETDGTVSAADDVAAGGGPAGARAGSAAEAATEETVRVLEFVVGDQAFCLDIAAVEEIVEHESVTRVPNAPECVSGVVDLRGQITTILDPRTFLDARGGADPSLIVVFDPVAFESQGAVGWLVDEVSRVASVPESAVTDAPGDDDHVKGVLDREDEDDLIVWIDPHAALDLVTSDVASADG